MILVNRVVLFVTNNKKYSHSPDQAATALHPQQGAPDYPDDAGPADIRGRVEPGQADDHHGDRVGDHEVRGADCQGPPLCGSPLCGA